MAIFSLVVSQPEFAAAFGLIHKLCRPRPGEEAILCFDGHCLSVHLGGMAVSAIASGLWPGEARAPASFVMGLAAVPPVGEGIEFRVEGGEIRAGTTVAPCVWQPAGSRCIVLPEGASDVDVLALVERHDVKIIIASGLVNVVKGAQKRKESAVDDAFAVLARYGVTHREVGELLRRGEVYLL